VKKHKKKVLLIKASSQKGTTFGLRYGSFTASLRHCADDMLLAQNFLISFIFAGLWQKKKNLQFPSIGTA